MKIKILTSFFSPNKGYAIGEEYDVPATEGNLWIDRGLAEPVKAKPPVEKPKK
jgi:hypothetical protein